MKRSTARRPGIQVSIPMVVFREAETYVAFTPAFDLATHGDTAEDAKAAFGEALSLFVEQVTRLGTWRKVLEEYGWREVRKRWEPPAFVEEEDRQVNIPVPV